MSDVFARVREQLEQISRYAEKAAWPWQHLYVSRNVVDVCDVLSWLNELLLALTEAEAVVDQQLHACHAEHIRVVDLWRQELDTVEIRAVEAEAELRTLRAANEQLEHSRAEAQGRWLTMRQQRDDADNKRAALQAQLATAQRQTWQPIETAPKDGRNILVTDGRHVWQTRAITPGLGSSIVGWMPMPLPDPPVAGSAGEGDVTGTDKQAGQETE